MKKRITEISGYFKVEKLKNDKQIIVFAICLMIASGLWFLNALSKDYSTSVSYPVKFVSPPKNQFVSNELPQKLELQVQAHGFTLLRHKLSLSFSPIILNLTNITRGQDQNDGVFTIRMTDIETRITDQVSKEISVTAIRPEYFTLVLDSLKTKTVPVIPNIKTEFKAQFNLKEPVYSIPGEVQITGPAILIDTLKVLKTVYKEYNKLDAEIERIVAVLHPERTTIRPEKVTLKIPIEKYTEKEIRIPVQLKNNPDEIKIKFFPSEVKVSVLVGLSEFENITSSDFSATVDYSLIENNIENPEIIVESKSTRVEILRISPETAEYLIETD